MSSTVKIMMSSAFRRPCRWPVRLRALDDLAHPLAGRCRARGAEAPLTDQLDVGPPRAIVVVMTNFWEPDQPRHLLPRRRVLPAVLVAEAGVIFAGAALNFLSLAQLALAVICLAGADVIAWLVVHRR